MICRFFRKGLIFCKLLNSVCLCVFLLSSCQQVNAQQSLNLPQSQQLLHTTPSFTPMVIKGIKVHPEDPLLFDFIIEPGDENLTGDALQSQIQQLIKYFMAALTVPDKDVWVNLSPLEADRILPENLEETQMGADLLAQDYVLKQLTASLLFPEDEVGKSFWKRVYEQAYARFGTTDIPVDTFNKVWIVTEKAVVYENGESNAAFVGESYLKVMLEKDYLASKSKTEEKSNQGISEEVSNFSADVIREIILPEIEREVNEGKHFATLRQIYHSMILANWFKKRLKESLLGKKYVNQDKVHGIEIDGETQKEEIYNQYLKTYQEGTYNFIREDFDEWSGQEKARKYVAGGFSDQLPEKLEIETPSAEFLSKLPGKSFLRSVTRFVRQKFSPIFIAGTIACTSVGCSSLPKPSFTKPSEQFIEHQLSTAYAPKHTQEHFENLQDWLKVITVFFSDLDKEEFDELLEKARQGAEAISEKGDKVWGEKFAEFQKEVGPLLVELLEMADKLERTNSKFIFIRLQNKMAERVGQIPLMLNRLNQDLLLDRGWMLRVDPTVSDKFALFMVNGRVVNKIRFGDRPDRLDQSLIVPEWNVIDVNPPAGERGQNMDEGSGAWADYTDGMVFDRPIDSELGFQEIRELIDPNRGVPSQFMAYRGWAKAYARKAIERDGYLTEDGKLKDEFSVDLQASIREHELTHAINMLVGKALIRPDYEGIALAREFIHKTAYTRLFGMVLGASLEYEQIKKLLQVYDTDPALRRFKVEDFYYYNHVMLFLAERAGRSDLAKRIKNFEDGEAPKELFDHLFSLSREEFDKIGRAVYERFRRKAKIPKYWNFVEMNVPVSHEGQSNLGPNFHEYAPIIGPKADLFTGSYSPPMTIQSEDAAEIARILTGRYVDMPRDKFNERIGRILKKYRPLLDYHSRLIGDFETWGLKTDFYYEGHTIILTGPNADEYLKRVEDLVKQLSPAIRQTAGFYNNSSVFGRDRLSELLLLTLPPVAFIRASQNDYRFTENKLRPVIITEKTLGEFEDGGTINEEIAVREIKEIINGLKGLSEVFKTTPRIVQDKLNEWIESRQGGYRYARNENDLQASVREVLVIFDLAGEKPEALAKELIANVDGGIKKAVINNARESIQAPDVNSLPLLSLPAKPKEEGSQQGSDAFLLSTPGGIDLNTPNLQVEARHGEVQLGTSVINVQNVAIPGLSPLIEQIDALPGQEVSRLMEVHP